MDWVTTTLFWYIHLFFIGIIFLPLTKRLFSKFFDKGYAFSKTLGVICISYLTFILGIFHIAPFTQTILYLVIGIFGAINLYIYLKSDDKGEFIFGHFSKQFVYIFEELLFIVSILFLAYVRGQEPSLHGLEKFMDFGFMNSILNSTHFPPLDMWYSAGPDLKGVEHAAGFPINYYYFGHLTGAMLIKLTNIPSYIGYNLVLATIFAQAITLTFSLTANVIHSLQNGISKQIKGPSITTYIFGLLGSFLLNLAGNLHTIYLFTKGYTNDSPTPFWKIWSSFDPGKYWYPNATRFIPFTIHEFPSYSYVVADLHGHVFDIPFVLLTLAVLFHTFFGRFLDASSGKKEVNKPTRVKKGQYRSQFSMYCNEIKKTVVSWNGLITVFLGFMCAVQYMTNAFDGPFYLLLTLILFFVMYRLSQTFVIHAVLLCAVYFIVSLPFTLHFSLFVSGIGVNCPPNFLFQSSASPGTSLKIGPFLFEKGNCQKSPLWMLFLLWGFFWTNFIIFLSILTKETFFGKKRVDEKSRQYSIDVFMLILFCFGTFLLIIPEFFYVKDIYPAHFRANTMFKLGYQAFMMMSIASTYVLYRVKQLTPHNPYLTKALAIMVFVVFYVIFQSSKAPTTPSVSAMPLEYLFFVPFIFLIVSIIFYRRSPDTILGLIFTYVLAHLIMLVAVYPFFSFPSYYTSLQKKNPALGQPVVKTSLDGQAWVAPLYSEDLELINYINAHITGQPVILEAQGDSYTDYDVISAYTGNPTISGWWVHEWLWRGSADVVGKRIPDITNIYESTDLSLTKSLLQKYHVKYVIVSQMEHKKYPNLDEEKFNVLGKKIFQSSNGFGALYKLN
jgi:YYY domain-containing protein